MQGGLQQLPVLLQLRAVDLSPRLYESLLRLWQTTAQALDTVHGEHRRMFLVVRMEVRLVVLPTGFDEHPNDDPEKRESSGTNELYIVRRSRCRLTSWR